MGSWDHFGNVTGSWDLLLIQGTTPIINEDLILQCGVTALQVEDSVTPGLDTWGAGGHVSLDYEFAPGWVGRAFVEDHETRLEKRAVRGMLMLSTTLDSGVAQ